MVFTSFGSDEIEAERELRIVYVNELFSYKNLLLCSGHCELFCPQDYVLCNSSDVEFLTTRTTEFLFVI